MTRHRVSPSASPMTGSSGWSSIPAPMRTSRLRRTGYPRFRRVWRVRNFPPPVRLSARN